MNFVTAKPQTPEIVRCEKHGAYEVRYADWITREKFMVLDDCQQCTQEDEAARQAAEKLEMHEKLKRLAGLGSRHLGCTLENYEAKNPGQAMALKSVSAYVDAIETGASACLIMSGKVGTGKTHLAAAMINRLVERGQKCRIVKLSDLIREIKSTWARDAERSEKFVIQTYSTVPVLIIDEVGVQFGSDTEKLLISEIIDNRYQEMRPTVLISNLDAQGIKGVIGERCYDRLREDGGKVIAFDWESHRGKAA